jgi:polyisoprenoid-binding protein YceI
MRRLALVFAAFLFALPAFAESVVPREASGTYKLDRSHTNVIFSLSHLGYSQYMGRFNTMDAKLQLNAEDLSKSQVSVTLTPASVDVNNTELQDKLRGETFFNVAQFPEIKFESTQIVRTGRKAGTITGNLTMLGVTKPVVLNATFNDAGMNPYANVYTIGFSATATLKRSDWGMKAYVPQVGDEVNLIISAEFHKEEGAATPASR